MRGFFMLIFGLLCFALLDAASLPEKAFISNNVSYYDEGIPEEDMKYYAQQPYADNNTRSPMLMGPDLPPDPGEEDPPEVPVGGTLPLVLFGLVFLLLRAKNQESRIKTKE